VSTLREQLEKRRDELALAWSNQDACDSSYQAGFTAALDLLLPAVEALEKIEAHKMNSADKVYLIHQCEGFQTCAARALTALRLKLEDSK
jgi:hypothetical protein